MYELKPADEINLALAELPKASMVGLRTTRSTSVPDWKGIEVDGKVVFCVSDQYELVQHEEAFKPIIEGLTKMGTMDFKFNVWSTPRKANLNIYVGEGYDQVSFGFRAMNGFGGIAVRYSFSSFTKTKFIEIVGYRQVCSNGMKVRVPLNEAEFVKPEEREKITSLLAKNLRIVHAGEAHKKVEAIQYVVEALLWLKEPLQRIIQKAEQIQVPKDKAEAFIKKYVGKRQTDKILKRYEDEQGSTLWNLYNSITFVASHEEDLKVGRRESLLTKASVMLEQELVATA